ncbi:hypothetical protein M405DRAFT_827609 [Rhizopogon salebrosus TDB-379]|nr:hypothetical protein M405DRAFT_827609 [Rhizopogon salebrosus TDB-379]
MHVRELYINPDQIGRVLDHQDIADFEIRIVHISKSSQQTIGRRQVHEIFAVDGE